MKIKRRSILKLSVFSALGSLSYVVLAGGSWPSRPVRLVLPYPPGGATDRLARVFASELEDELKQRVIVENRAGATGAVGSAAVAKSPPDGYSLLTGFLGSMVVQPLLNSSLPYDSQKDFTPIARLVTYDFLLVASPDFAANNIDELTSITRSGEKKISYGTTGIGSPGHLAMANYSSKSGAQLQDVPYQGEQPMVLDLLGGHLELGMLTVNVAEPLLKTGKIKAIAVASENRAGRIPEVPTFRESGFPGSSVQTWAGILGPSNLPEPIVERLNAGIEAVLKRAKLQDDLMEIGFSPDYLDAAEFSRLIESERSRYRDLIEIAGIKVE